MPSVRQVGGIEGCGGDAKFERLIKLLGYLRLFPKRKISKHKPSQDEELN